MDRSVPLKPQLQNSARSQEKAFKKEFLTLIQKYDYIVVLFIWLFLVTLPSIEWCCCKSLQVSTFHPSAERWILFLLRYRLTHGQNMAKRKQSFLLISFGFTSTKLNQDNQNVGRKLVPLRNLTFMLVHHLTSLLFVEFQHKTGALVRGRPPQLPTGISHTE